LLLHGAFGDRSVYLLQNPKFLNTKEDFLNGQILLIDKPLEWTSFQAVNALKWAIRKKFSLKKIKIGHAGTLDPLATGLLIICTGKFTKKIPELQGQVKEYTGTFTLGATTPSYDLETEVNETFPTDHITDTSIKETTTQFLGVIDQVPPIFSALKKDGKRLYELAREGKQVEIKSRKIEMKIGCLIFLLLSQSRDALFTLNNVLHHGSSQLCENTMHAFVANFSPK